MTPTLEDEVKILRAQLEQSSASITFPFRHFNVPVIDERIASLEETVQDLRIQPADSQLTAKQKEDSPGEVVRLLHVTSSAFIVTIAPLVRRIFGSHLTKK